MHRLTVVIGAMLAVTGCVMAAEAQTAHQVQEIVFDAPPSGTYYFLCDVHPNMNGELVVR